MSTSYLCTVKSRERTQQVISRGLKKILALISKIACRILRLTSSYLEEFLLSSSDCVGNSARSSCLAVIFTTMSRLTSITMLSRRVCWLITEKTQPLSSKYSTMMHSPNEIQSNHFPLESPKNRINHNSTQFQHNNSATVIPHQIGENVPRKDKITFLVNTLMDLNNSKEVVYSTLDAWVAWERNFPIGALKNVLLILEKDQQWHRMIQVLKWMLSKGQGNTRGTYGQLIQALDMDDRAEEAYEIWKKKLAFDLHSVPWKLCKLMISIYYRNNRLEDLVKLFKGLEHFDRKPPEKSIVRKVADAYEILGKSEEKERILEKYKDLFTETANGKAKKHSNSHSHKGKSGKKG